MDNVTLLWVAYIAASLLGFIIWWLIWFWIIRSAIISAGRKLEREKQQSQQRWTNA